MTETLHAATAARGHRPDLEPAPTVLQIRELVVGPRPQGGGAATRNLVDGASLVVHRGEMVGLVGESGSGKTLTALAAADLLPAALQIRGGQVLVDGVDVAPLGRRAARRHLSSSVGIIFQNPTSSLNPRLRIDAQLREALPRGTSRQQRRELTGDLLGQVGVPNVVKTLGAYPHELSGGLNQRVMIAIALARRPGLLIADEPTTALDVSVQAQVLDLIDQLRADLGIGVLLVSHDIGVIADRTSIVSVMSQGRIVETGDTAEVLRSPRHDYTRRLLAAVPQRLAPLRLRSAERDESPVHLEITQARRSFVVRGPAGSRHFTALDGVDLTLRQGQAIGLVGESGSGKTTLARAVVGLERLDSGTIRYQGQDPDELDRAAHRRWRRDVQYVFQDPYSSLDPRLTVQQTLREPLELNHSGLARATVNRRVEELLDEVELPGAFRTRFPSELSGGQRQRVGIARALASDPALIVADEPVSALDLSVQARVLALFGRLRQERALSFLFISHDLTVVRYLCEDLVVLRRGTVVEQGPTETVLRQPAHPYTRSLVDAVPGRALSTLPAPTDALDGVDPATREEGP
ncbi:dipeptide ABC transporter ATP-binding protein [Nakamurella leprariae]|uniref:ABC transporter ATP-binding protein n=1 Tax=Nakamurella leprariae TaxID=2803911 RepID=A0A938Y4N6_9ACTN|nr:ABC transporter ATP-binding protein [Nakamurella leprariae]MBM9465675.1 ABC transporter ATP-binding protein [Nakamurella leprariae]